MKPVTTVDQMRAADQAAIEAVGSDVLVRRAGTAVAHEALSLMGGAYGRRVVVVAGRGNNGADGRVAAAFLARRGARVEVVQAGTLARLPPCDLVVDAAYGTGFRGTYDAPPAPGGAEVLAVDIPSGVEGDTGAAKGTPMGAARTVALGALKPAHLQGEGALLCGKVVVAPIGIAVDRPSMVLVDDADVAGLLPRREAGAHKWSSAVALVAGSPGMEGAASLCARGASHGGAGMVRLAVPGSETVRRRAQEGGGGTGRRIRLTGPWPSEAVRIGLPAEGWARAVLEAAARCRSLVIGPGLGRSPDGVAEVRRVVAACPVPVVVDADALWALGTAEEVREIGGSRASSLVLTPHDGEYRRLAGMDPGPDRRAAALRLAERTGAVVLLKGWPTVVAVPPTGPIAAPSPGGPRADWPAEAFVTSGSARLATAGTGDVLSGVIGAFLARGLAPAPAAALAAHAHGRAAALGAREGLVAGDLPDLVRQWLSAVVAIPGAVAANPVAVAGGAGGGGGIGDVDEQEPGRGRA